MNPVPDRNQRKQEIGNALRNEPYLPHEADPEIYEAVCLHVGATTNHDIGILISVVQDAIMMARRDERPTIPLDTFRDWLMRKQME
ncbi:MAG: hypothetical protein IJH25_17840 [Clostridia bacterium]|nr:hypothetical protein [Clostridia bacterium]